LFCWQGFVVVVRIVRLQKRGKATARTIIRARNRALGKRERLCLKRAQC
jgi:hypothetical protein